MIKIVVHWDGRARGRVWTRAGVACGASGDVLADDRPHEVTCEACTARVFAMARRVERIAEWVLLVGAVACVACAAVLAWHGAL